ncbi:MAG: sugar ABC transporter permease, partial [Alphaproteobacteria bacterium]|nr:sugar ABC transporter permease [Alphaproteobacteria bacterium]
MTARRRPWYRREMSAGSFAFFMNVPTLLCLGLVLAYPVIYAGYLSVHKVGLAQLRRGEFAFTGWENYGRVLDDPLFWVALKNTLIFTTITVGSEIVLAVMIALLINQTSVWTSRVTRFLILLPYAIPPIANGLIWSFLYSFQFGFLNRILFSAGL